MGFRGQLLRVARHPHMDTYAATNLHTKLSLLRRKQAFCPVRMLLDLLATCIVGSLWKITVCRHPANTEIQQERGNVTDKVN